MCLQTNFLMEPVHLQTMAGTTIDEIKYVTEANLIIPDDIKIMDV